MKLYRVGEICRRTGLSRKHLFMYKHVVPPVATEYEGAYKLYDEAGLKALEQIAQLRRMGLHKPQFLMILEDPMREKELLQEQHVHLREELERLAAQLELVHQALESIHREEEE